ncbi:hypothetical protein FD723_40640 (plasmid) [Nostoc sp. C052]|uniref:hypothetical protein n=1 Tax=Nostoc sp. C052 TaxID=2576902 RepID=UPI0015C33996|nr:hypothetical protein [Nostoc sp. C052]QLE46523.1 hypothetical protein FD723_40640 [Nostoc sp. C052]
MTLSRHKLKRAIHYPLSARARARINRREPMLVLNLDYYLAYCQQNTQDSTLRIETDHIFVVEGLRKYWQPVIHLAQEQKCDRVFIYLNDNQRPYYKIFDWYLELSHS